MKKIVLATVAATCFAGSAFAADLAVKAPPPAPVATNPWDIAFGSGIYSDYNFRGISQSNRGPSVNAYFEPRYNINENLQLYAGVGAWSIDFPNRARAEIDLYGGIRPTFGKFAFDFGGWYYYYPGGSCYNGFPGWGECSANGSLNNDQFGLIGVNGGNAIKKDLSFGEVFAKGTYTINDYAAVGAAFFYDINWLNFGFDAKYLSGNVKFTAPSTWLPTGYGVYLSAEVGHYWLGTTDSYYGTGVATLYAGGIPLADYTTWNVGVGLTYKVFTVDVRYYDTDLTKAECNAITSDFTAKYNPNNITGWNPSGLGSNWCGQQFVVSLKADLTYGANIK